MSEAAAALALLTIDKFEKGVEDSISDQIVEYFHFKSKGAFHTGQHGIGRSWQARTSRGTVVGFKRETRLSPKRVNRDVRARLTNRGYGIGEMLHTTDMWENGSPEKLMDLLADMTEGMEGDLFAALGDGFYDDGTDATYDGLGFQGMDAALITAGSYAGLALATNARFFSSLVESGNTVVTAAAGTIFATFSSDPLPVLNEIVKRCRVGGKQGRGRKKPDVGFMSHDLFNIVQNTLVRAGTMAINNKILNVGGFENIVYRGVTWFPSDNVPANFIYCLTSSWIDFNFPSPKVINTYSEKSGIPLAVYSLLIVYGMLRVKLPRTCGRFAVL